MTLRTTRNGIEALAALLVLATGAFGTTVNLDSGSRIRLEGTSTLHPFASETSSFSLDLNLEPAAGAQALGAAIQARAPAKMTVTIPVASLKSEHNGLDKNLQKALKADKNPDIVFMLRGYKANGAAITASGDLTLAGQTKPETLTASFSMKDGRAVIDGQQPLLMTDFGVRPPTMMMGTVKTGDRVLVKFHLVLKQSPDEPRNAK